MFTRISCKFSLDKLAHIILIPALNKQNLKLLGKHQQEMSSTVRHGDEYPL